MAEITNNLTNFQKDQLDALLSRSFNWHGRPQANVVIIGNVKVTNKGDIILDQGRGVKWYQTAVAFGLINSLQAVSFYTNNILRAWINSNGFNIGGSTDITFNTDGRGIKWSDVAVTLGTINSKNSVGFYANSTLRAYINSDGLSINDKDIKFLTSGKGIYFANVTTVAILGSTVSIDMYVASNEILGIADNGSSTTESGLYLRQNATLKQCHWIDGADGYRYLACTHE